MKRAGVSILARSDFENMDEDTRARGAAAGSEGLRTKRDCEKVGRRARELLAEAARGAPPALPKRRSLKKATLDDLLKQTIEVPARRKAVFRDVEVEEDTSEAPDLLDIMAHELEVDEREGLALDQIMDLEQAAIEATLAGVGERRE